MTDQTGPEVPPPEERFFKITEAMTALVQELVTDASMRGHKIINPFIITLAGAYLSSLDRKKLISNFINYSHMHWDKICNHEEIFFCDHARDIFRDLPVDIKNVDAFKLLFTLTDDKGQPVICQDDRDAIWDFFEGMVRVAIKYIHIGRRPSIKTDKTTGAKRPVYTANFFTDVELEKYAHKWDIKLEFTR